MTVFNAVLKGLGCRRIRKEDGDGQREVVMIEGNYYGFLERVGMF